MILRRLTEHVRTQNWFAVALDFFIVVLGVFIGLQVQEWSLARQEQAQRASIIASLMADIQSDRDEMQSALDRLQLSVSAARYVLEEVGEPASGGTIVSVSLYTIDIDSGVVPFPPEVPIGDEVRPFLWSTLVFSTYPTAALSAYEALVNTGKLELIASDALIRELQTYRQLWVGLEAAQAGSLRPLRHDALFTGHKYGLAPFTETDEQALLRKVSENPELRATIQTVMHYNALRYRQISAIDRNAAHLLDELGARTPSQTRSPSPNG
ncbi:MAG: hypothetical protein AAGH41_04050 [Pseudomonadota bacterium]